MTGRDETATPRYPWLGLLMSASIGAVLGWIEAAIPAIGLLAGAGTGAVAFAILQHRWGGHHVR